MNPLLVVGEGWVRENVPGLGMGFITKPHVREWFSNTANPLLHISRTTTIGLEKSHSKQLYLIYIPVYENRTSDVGLCRRGRWWWWLCNKVVTIIFRKLQHLLLSAPPFPPLSGLPLFIRTLRTEAQRSVV